MTTGERNRHLTAVLPILSGEMRSLGPAVSRAVGSHIGDDRHVVSTYCTALLAFIATIREQGAISHRNRTPGRAQTIAAAAASRAWTRLAVDHRDVLSHPEPAQTQAWVNRKLLEHASSVVADLCRTNGISVPLSEIRRELGL